ncbi:MAG: helix-turn-helix transcriptional regulator [bacterium]|nr:helix-turn-helix transcriptional regulator [bacterium]
MKRIMELRKEKHLTQIGLGLRLNVSQKMISAYESGTHQPSIDTLIEMSKIFNVSVDYIIENTNIRTPVEQLTKDTLTPNELELLDIFKRLDPEKQQRSFGILFALERYESAQS